MFEELQDRPEFRPGLRYGAMGWLSGVGLILLLVLVPAVFGASGVPQLPMATAAIVWNNMHGWAAILGGRPGLLILSAIPATMLGGMGYLTARATAEAAATGFRRGAWTTTGYLPLVVLGFGYWFLRFGLASGSSAGDLISLNLLGLVIPIVITGVGFPAVFGGLGGYLYEWREDTGDSQATH